MTLRTSRRNAASRSTDDFAHRCGAAALALLAGMAVGLALAWLPLAFDGIQAGMPTFIFGGAIAGAVTGLLFPSAAMAGVEGVLHFFIGAGSMVAEAPLTPSRHSPSWLKACLVFGMLFALVLWILV